MKCPEGAVCDRGRCLPSCTCNPGSICSPGEACDLAAPVPTCTEAACVGVRCPPASHCELGSCVDDCEGVVCPPMRVCKKVSVNGGASRAKCVDLCSPDPCKLGYECEWRTGGCTPLPFREGALTPPSDPIERLEVAGGGWLCNGAGLARVSAITALASAGAVVMFILRRRRRG
ncbi:MAG TPA: hypothetical protein VM925_13055 [Labilithrix sp.]|nr:hypothetical protein [Labilithrix sp.]